MKLPSSPTDAPSSRAPRIPPWRAHSTPGTSAPDPSFSRPAYCCFQKLPRFLLLNDMRHTECRPKPALTPRNRGLEKQRTQKQKPETKHPEKHLEAISHLINGLALSKWLLFQGLWRPQNICEISSNQTERIENTSRENKPGNIKEMLQENTSRKHSLFSCLTKNLKLTTYNLLGMPRFLLPSLSNVPRASKRAPHVRTVKVFPQIHQRKESAQDSRLQVVRQVQPACRYARQAFPVLRDELHDFALPFLWRVAQRRLPPHL